MDKGAHQVFVNLSSEIKNRTRNLLLLHLYVKISLLPCRIALLLLNYAYFVAMHVICYYAGVNYVVIQDITVG